MRGVAVTDVFGGRTWVEASGRAGVRVTRCYQRTRWRDGRVWVWLGVHKQSGRGQGSSGLAFDRLIDV